MFIAYSALIYSAHGIILVRAKAVSLLSLRIRDIVRRIRCGETPSRPEYMLLKEAAAIKAVLKAALNNPNFRAARLYGGLSTLSEGEINLPLSAEQTAAAVMLALKPPQNAAESELCARLVQSALCSLDAPQGRFKELRGRTLHRQLKPCEAAYIDGESLSAAAYENRLLLGACGRTLSIRCEGLRPVLLASDCMEFEYRGAAWRLKLASAGAVCLYSECEKALCELARLIKYKAVRARLACEIVQGQGMCAVAVSAARTDLNAVLAALGSLPYPRFFESSRSYLSPIKLHRLLSAPPFPLTNDRLLVLCGENAAGITEHNLFWPTRIVTVAKGNRLKERELCGLRSLNAFLSRLGLGFSLLTLPADAPALPELLENSPISLKDGKYIFKTSPNPAPRPQSVRREPPFQTSIDQTLNLDKLYASFKIKPPANSECAFTSALSVLSDSLSDIDSAARRAPGLFSRRAPYGGAAAAYSDYAVLAAEPLSTALSALAALCAASAAPKILGQSLRYYDIPDEGFAPVSRLTASDTLGKHIIGALGWCMDRPLKRGEAQVYRYILARALALASECGLPGSELEPLRERLSRLPKVFSRSPAVRACFELVLAAPRPERALLGFARAVTLLPKCGSRTRTVLAALLENCLYRDLLGLRKRANMLAIKPAVAVKGGMKIHAGGMTLTVSKAPLPGLKSGGVFYSGVSAVALVPDSSAEIHV